MNRAGKGFGHDAAGEVVHAIDLGTSCSSVLIGRSDASTVPVRDPASTRGGTSVRSAVCALADGSVAVGAKAERAARTRPGAFRDEFKADIGSGTPSRLAGRSMTAEEMTTYLAAFLRAQALRAVDTEPVLTVVTVPAAWEAPNRERTRDALVAAGYGRVEIRSEPEAAARMVEGDGTTLVYDLGGGTFDCALARTGDGVSHVVDAPDGDPHVGGAAFDRLVLGRVRERFPEAWDGLYDRVGDDDVDVQRRRIELRLRCEEIKMSLSVGDHAEDLLGELRPTELFALARDELGALLAGPLDRTLDACERMLFAAEMEWSDIDRVALVGGSSRLPMVADAVRARARRPVVAVDEPELAVVRGAVRIAADLAWHPTDSCPEARPEPRPSGPGRYDLTADIYSL